MTRPPQIGDVGFDVRLYSKEEAGKPTDDCIQVIAGKLTRVTGARYAVWRVKWTGQVWRQFRRASGPLKYADALARLEERVKGENGDDT